MEDEDKYQRYAHLPIPTYEEATSSRPTSAHGLRGAQEVSDDAERQDLLGDADNAVHHRVPTVESPRSSEDSNLDLPEVIIGNGDYDRRQIEELDYLESSDDNTSQTRRGLRHRARLRGISKHLANLSATFSSLRLPSLRSLYSPLSNGDADSSSRSHPPVRWQAWLARFSNPFHIPEHYKVSAPIFARLFGLFLIAAVIYVLFMLDMFPGKRQRQGARYNSESIRTYIQDKTSAASIREYLEHITSYDHVAGTEGDFYLTNWMQDRWIEWNGFDEVAVLDNHVYLNYPNHEGRSVKIVEPRGKRWTAQLEENLVNQTKQQSLSWHGHSKSGDATGHLIYAHGGSREDFDWLKRHNLRTEGAIALLRYHASPANSAMKVKAAHEAGCAGVLIYTDPSDDGSEKGEVWPEGPWRSEDSVQRDSVGLLGWIIGDPLTPGWSSQEQSKTISKESSPALPQIPSLPISWREAKVLIAALDGQGVHVPNRWRGGTDRTHRWFSGSHTGNGAPMVELRNRNDENDKQQIWNLHGLIQGVEEPEKKIFIGSHRDAWCFGAADPGSATAVMMEVVDIFGGLVKAGWRPLRTIQFASWDASEFNLMGSTEYVEDEIDYLYKNGVAYINVDVGVWGHDFRASGSPMWRKPLQRALNRVTDPATNESLRTIWHRDNKDLRPPRTHGDSVAFQDMAGMTSIDFGFKGPSHAYPRHSCYDTFGWMEKFGDPDFEYHRALAQVWALLILEVADREILPFDLAFYIREIRGYVEKLQRDAVELYSKQRPYASVNARVLRDVEGFDVSLLRTAAANATENVKTFHAFEDEWTRHTHHAGGLETADDFVKRIAYNDKLSHFETDLLDLPEGDDDKGQHGIPGREQYKHVIFGPSLWSKSADHYFPAVRDAMETGDWEQAQRMVEVAARVLDRAGKRLVEEG